MSEFPAMNDGAPRSAKPRALILDLFGDYLRYTAAEVRAGDLVSLLGVFGVEPATVRVTLSRLRREKWFTSTRHGREVTYMLSSHMLGVLQHGRERIFADYDESWDRTWTTFVQQNPKPDRLARERLRRELTWLGFGSLSASTWMAPRDRTAQLQTLAVDFPAVRFAVLRSQAESAQVDRELAAQCWNLGKINGLYETFLTDHAHLVDSAATLDGEQALVARTSLIASYRRFPFLDPWLPADLRPAGWHGASANAVFRAAHRNLGPKATAFVQSVVDRPIEAPFI